MPQTGVVCWNPTRNTKIKRKACKKPTCALIFLHLVTKATFLHLVMKATCALNLVKETCKKTPILALGIVRCSLLAEEHQFQKKVCLLAPTKRPPSKERECPGRLPSSSSLVSSKAFLSYSWRKEYWPKMPRLDAERPLS